MTFNITAHINVSGRYKVSLSKRSAKAICAEFLDPDEDWDSQAEDCLSCALEYDLEEIMRDHLFAALPQKVAAEIQGAKLSLQLDGEEASIELDELEVES